MTAITTFLQSDQALKILGLPGLALLLAFVFYRTLVSARVIRSVGKNQSFAILVLIIVYFLIVSVLVIWVYRPERQGDSQAAGATAISEPKKPTAWQIADGFLVRTRLDTPLATFDSTLGPATGDSAAGEDLPNLRTRSYFTLADGLLVSVGHDRESVHWIAAFDQSKKLRIPGMHMGQGQDDGSERTFERLSDFDLEFVADSCERLEAPFAGRNGLYVLYPCYFGRPASYYTYAFIFQADERQLPLDTACSPLELERGAVTAAKIRACHIADARPVGFVVIGEDKHLAAAVTNFLQSVDS